MRARAAGWLAVAALALGGAGLGWGWQMARVWRPDGATYPLQGAWLDSANLPVDWPALRRSGARFVYFSASRGGTGRDSGFADVRAGLFGQHLALGPVHLYDICVPGDQQAANFETIVPRAAPMLPAAVVLDLANASCPDWPTPPAVESEMVIFLNQIERHTGKPAILMPTQAFENHYHISAAIRHPLWVAGNFWLPGYVTGHASLWTANDMLRNPAAQGAIRWAVVVP